MSRNHHWDDLTHSSKIFTWSGRSVHFNIFYLILCPFSYISITLAYNTLLSTYSPCFDFWIEPRDLKCMSSKRAVFHASSSMDLVSLNLMSSLGATRVQINIHTHIIHVYSKFNFSFTVVGKIFFHFFSKWWLISIHYDIVDIVYILYLGVGVDKSIYTTFIYVLGLI